MTEIPNGWYQIERPGLFPNSRAGVTQVLDEVALATIATNFAQARADYARTYGREFPGFPIDEEHLKLAGPHAPSAANGWLMNVRHVPGDGLEGEIRWTNTGQPKVAGGTLRFFSTEYDAGSLAPVDGDKTRVRPTRLTGLTLTNMPNNQGARPITNRKPEEPLVQPPTQNEPMKRLLMKLGLAAEASEDAAMAALDTVLNRETAATAEAAKLKGEITTLTNRAAKAEGEVKEIQNRAAETAVEFLARSAKLSDEEKVDARNLFLTNREAYDRYATRLTGQPAAGVTPPTLQNRAAAPALPAADAKQAANASAVRTKAEEIQRDNPRRPWGDCWRQAAAALAKA